MVARLEWERHCSALPAGGDCEHSDVRCHSIVGVVVLHDKWPKSGGHLTIKQIFQL